jgi:hypothetical protein
MAASKPASTTWRFFIFLFIFLAMAGLSCDGCNAPAKNKASLHRHQRGCEEYLQFLDNLAALSSEPTSGPPILKAKHRLPPKNTSTLRQRKTRIFNEVCNQILDKFISN